MINDGSGATSVNKSGTGTWVVSGANGYSGGTTVSLGTLVVGNASALGTGAVNIANGGTVSNGTGGNYAFADNVTNNGTIDSGGYDVSFGSGKTLNGSGLIEGGGTFTVNGTLSPGNSPGIISVGAATTLDLTIDTVTIWEIGSVISPVAGTDYDTFSLNPTAIVNVDGILDIELIDGVSTLDAYWEANHTFTLFGGGGTANGVFGGGLTGEYTFTTVSGGTGLFSYADGSPNLVYTYTPVPEPQTWALVAVGLSVVLFRLRRKALIEQEKV